MKKQMLTIAAFAALTLASCSKDDAPTPDPVKTPQEMIVGKWQTEFWAWDQNHNTQLEESEKEPADEENTYLLTFAADGKLTITYNEDGDPQQPTSITGSYQLINNNQQVAMHFISGGSGDDTMKILTLDASKLFLYNTIDEGTITTGQWHSLNKVN